MLSGLCNQYNCEAIVFNDLDSIRYLSGFKGSNALFICTNDGHFLITDSRYQLEASLTVKNAQVIVVDNSCDIYRLSNLLGFQKIKNLGVFSKTILLEMYNNFSKDFNIKTIDIDPAVLRIKKTYDELLNIKKAISIQEYAFKELLLVLGNTPSEKELAYYLEYLMLQKGAEKESFDTIVAFAENSAMPHAKSSSKKIEGDGFLLIDFGAKYNGYCSDQTLTLIIGLVDELLLKIYDAVYTAQKKAIDAVKEGVRISQLSKIAYGYLEDQGYSKFIKHSLGHGVGLAIHELPTISSVNEAVLEQGMVITIEPGLYVPDKGGVRLEDMLYVDSDGASVLTTLPKERKIII